MYFDTIAKVAVLLSLIFAILKYFVWPLLKVFGKIAYLYFHSSFTPRQQILIISITLVGVLAITAAYILIQHNIEKQIEHFSSMDVLEVANNKDALRIGGQLFSDYCANCHGEGGEGKMGVPNLRDKDWLRGVPNLSDKDWLRMEKGSPVQIRNVIANGIENNIMPAFGKTIGQSDISQITNYVLALSNKEVDIDKYETGKRVFVQYCIVCHGANGEGNPSLGAPNLTDNIWIYGGNFNSIKHSIQEGRQNSMPKFEGKIKDSEIHLLTAYVYSLSN